MGTEHYLLGIWGGGVFVISIVYAHYVWDNSDEVFEKVIVAGCVFWPLVVFVYLLGGLIDLLKWSFDSLWEHVS